MKIELLSPAGDAHIGRCAIDAGADAVYIGGPAFGARAAAGNSLESIASLAEYAHSFGARVFMTMNTILFDDELKKAQEVACEAWKAGVDALIVQDAAFLKMDLPPIELHSSTQMFNMGVERVAMAQKMGFKRVVLERAMTLSEISQVHKECPNLELEAFIHGAICVGYSGQCYLSHALCGRGGNRGGCAQSCRSRYDLYDGKGELLHRGKELLSVGDMALGERVKDLIDAGVCSLKIEGRLKDERYVVNTVAYYDDILKKLGASRVSHGDVERNFVPNPKKTFSRNGGLYFFDNPRAKVGAATKSLGEALGEVLSVNTKGEICLRSEQEVVCGDGLCWTKRSGEVCGGAVNGVYRKGDQWLIALHGAQPQMGDVIYRNYDKNFKPSSQRFLPVDIVWSSSVVTAQWEGVKVELVLDDSMELSNNQERTKENIIKSINKSCATIFRISSVDIQNSQLPFMPISGLNAIRTELLEKLLVKILASYERAQRKPQEHTSLDLEAMDYRANISNRLSETFYRESGVRQIERALEIGGEIRGKEVLKTRHCIRRQLGMCHGQGGSAESLYMENNGKRLRADFDCVSCQMSLIYLA